MCSVYLMAADCLLDFSISHPHFGLIVALEERSGGQHRDRIHLKGGTEVEVDKTSGKFPANEIADDFFCKTV